MDTQKVVAVVQQVEGLATAEHENGQTTIVQPGTLLYKGDHLQILNGKLLLKAANFSVYELITQPDVLLNGVIPPYGTHTHEDPELLKLQQAIAEGADPTALLEETAAGAGEGAANDGGISFLLFNPGYLEGLVTSGYDTIGPLSGEPEQVEEAFNFQTLNTESSPPPITFSGQVLRLLEEDDLSSGNNEDGSTGAAAANANISTITSGATSFGFNINSTNASTLVSNLNLTSGGVPLDNAVIAGNTVFVQAAGTTIFTITLAPTGIFSIEDLNKLDHPTSGSTEEYLANNIDLSEFF